jgi:hypothetical protein
MDERYESPRRKRGAFGVKWTSMQNDTALEPEKTRPVTPGPEKAGPETPPVDWADLRAQAAKLGISLSEFQQRDREKKLRLAKKNRGIPATGGALAKP